MQLRIYLWNFCVLLATYVINYAGRPEHRKALISQHVTSLVLNEDSLFINQALATTKQPCPGQWVWP